jgi:hypothetical protein
MDRSMSDTLAARCVDLVIAGQQSFADHALSANRGR